MRFFRPIDAGGKWRLRLFKWLGPPALATARFVQTPAEMYGRELLYERLFANGLARFGLENRYYASGGAASFSLLYLLLRAITELPIQHVVEFGCGQTTLLLDALQKVRPFKVDSFEHEPEWAGRIQEEVAHAINVADLVERKVRGRRTQTYDVPDALGSCNLLVVDGPQQRVRRSRWGALEWIEDRLDDDFLILFDDAERRGELDTIEEALGILRNQGRPVRTRFFHSVKWQFAIAGGACSPAVSF